MTKTETYQQQAEKQAEKAKTQLFSLFTDLYQLFVRANKPDRKQYISAIRVVLLGVLVMGFVGFIVKIASIPINNILLK